MVSFRKNKNIMSSIQEIIFLLNKKKTKKETQQDQLAAEI